MRFGVFLALLGAASAFELKFTPHLDDHLRVPEEARALEGDALVDYVNGLQTSWVATKEHRFAAASKEQAKAFMGLVDLPAELNDLLPPNPDNNRAAFWSDDLPEQFDAREQWPHCVSLRTVRDQSNCGSCWAVAAVAAISDRICIASHGQQQPEISAADLLGCCHLCGGGCHGGLPEAAWAFYWLHGLVSGGAYNDTGSCRPYPFKPCAHHSVSKKYPTCPDEIVSTPKCVKQCVTDDITYSKDNHKARYAYPILTGQNAIKREIFKNGPVEAGFTVYSDFLSYKSGVYQHKAGSFLGGHAVKILGWGAENGTDYWLVANSWNEDWGEGGFFKILRGHNHVGIETRIDAGVPRL